MEFHLEGTRFGRLCFDSKDVVAFPEGLVGYPDLNSYLVLDHAPDSPFVWLQSLDRPDLAFLTVCPKFYVVGYSPLVEVPGGEKKPVRADGEYRLLATVSNLDVESGEMALNLAAPIVLNMKARLGKQVVLEGEAYNIRHRVIPHVSEGAQKAA